MPDTSVDHLRRYAVARSLFAPTTLQRAIDRLGFVQADPIRAPARAQDLTLRHRVSGYRAGDLERLYATLDVHEDFFVNYGFVPSEASSLMHPRSGPPPWRPARRRRDEPRRPSAPSPGRRPPRRCGRGGGTRSARSACSPTLGAARRAPPPACSTSCTTAGCCAWCGATRGSACTPCTSTRRCRAIRLRGAPGWTRSWT